MANYFKLHLQTKILKNPYYVPLPKIPISFLQAIPVRAMFRSCLWEATMSPLLPNKRPLINWQLAWLSASSSHTVTRPSSSSLTSTESLCLGFVFDISHWNIGSHSFHNVGVTMQLPKATWLAALRNSSFTIILPLGAIQLRHWQRNILFCKQQKKSIF